MIIEYVSIVKMVKDEREGHEYIYDVFSYNDTNYLIFFTHYKYLFNIDPNYLKIRIIPTLIERMVNTEIIYDKQKY